jgi:hypothetical protein
MKPIRQSIEVARRPEDVFSYATDSRFPEWQVGAVTASPISSTGLVRALPSQLAQHP